MAAESIADFRCIIIEVVDGFHKNVAAGFIPAWNLALVFGRRSVEYFVQIGVMRRSGGDKPRHYTGWLFNVGQFQ